MRKNVNLKVRGRRCLVAAIFSVVMVAFSAPGLPTLGAQGPPERVDVLIGFRRTPGPDEEFVVRGAAGRIKEVFDIIPAIAASVPITALQGLRRNPNVTIVEPDAEVFALDAELDNTWGVKKIGGGLSSTAGSGIKVAVLDSGVDCTHPELMRSGVTICASGWDFINNDSNPADDNGHGTHVAGTIAAAKNASGVVGVAPKVTLYPLKVLGANGSGSYSAVISALQWAQKNGIQMTSNSYGSSTDPGTLVRQAFDNTATTMLHVVSAGNSGTCTGSTDTVGYPAKYASVIAVGATSSTNTRPCWSSTGSKVEIAAPGLSIKSTIPGGKYATYSGTSMAAPHVTGVAALVKAANPNLSPGQIRKVLQTTAVDIGTLGKDTAFGYGLVSATGATAAAAAGAALFTPKLSVPSITYSLSGGNVLMTVKVLNEYAGFATGSKVSIQVLKNGAYYSAATGVVGNYGTIAFQLANPPAGTYKATVTGVTMTGYAWNGIQPATNAGITK